MKSVLQHKFDRVHRPDAGDFNYRVVRRRYRSNAVRYWNDGWKWLDQGEEGACVGFGWGHWLANYPLRQLVDPRGIYNIAKMMDEWAGEDYEGTSVRAGAKVLQNLGFISQYGWAFELEEVLSVVLKTGPMVVGTLWYEDMCETDSKGFVHIGGEILGGHCYLITGGNVPQEKLRIKNSWGTIWGVKGRAWISFEDFARLLAEDGEACIATEINPASLYK